MNEGHDNTRRPAWRRSQGPLSLIPLIIAALLLGVVLLAQMAVSSASAETTSSTSPASTATTDSEPVLAHPTIVSDKADYAPGDLVTLTGANWTGDTGVRIKVDDNVGDWWYEIDTVLVRPDGTITLEVTLPSWVVATYNVTATGLQTGRVATTSFTDSAGSYTIKWYAADPELNKAPYLPTYQKLTPSELPAPTAGLSGGAGRLDGSSVLPHAVAYASPATPTNLDAVTSLSPKDLALGQVVPFEVEIAVSGSTTPENGVIQFTPYWSTKTTSGNNFGYDPAYQVYAAFVDTSDPGTYDPDSNAKVDSYTSTVVKCHPDGG